MFWLTFLETSSVAIKTPEVEHESSSGSPEESPDTPPSASPVIDADLARMEALLDNWCLDLKRNVLVSLALLVLFLNTQIFNLSNIIFACCVRAPVLHPNLS